ncbi:MAG: hypothetical protein LBN23_07865, partial [Paludibacter sp.]|nr:hypothetical protein [Paludibacter sp.]
MFDNRIEIHSPGILPYGVTVESIKRGISEPRNKLLFDNAKYLLPYTGVGSGIVRAMRSYDKIVFENDYITGEFIITIVRDEIAEELIISGGINGGVNGGINEGINLDFEGINGINEGINIDFEGINGGINGGINLSITANKIIEIIKFHEGIKIDEICRLLTKSRRT